MPDNVNETNSLIDTNSENSIIQEKNSLENS